MIGLCNAANAWDEDKGAFSTFAVRCIHHEICKEFRRRNRQKFTYSLDYNYSNSEDDPVLMGDSLVGDSDVDWVDLDDLCAVLTKNEREVVKLRSMGLTQSEIGKKIGASQQSVCSYLRRAKLRLEKANDD